MFSDHFKTDRTDAEARWIKERSKVLRKECPIGRASRLIEYMYVADIDEHWKKCEKSLTEMLDNQSAVFLLEQALVRQAKRDCDMLYDFRP
jgi:hypothetical protein